MFYLVFIVIMGKCARVLPSSFPALNDIKVVWPKTIYLLYSEKNKTKNHGFLTNQNARSVLSI